MTQNLSIRPLDRIAIGHDPAVLERWLASGVDLDSATGTMARSERDEDRPVLAFEWLLQAPQAHAFQAIAERSDVCAQAWERRLAACTGVVRFDPLILAFVNGQSWAVETLLRAEDAVRRTFAKNDLPDALGQPWENRLGHVVTQMCIQSEFPLENAQETELERWRRWGQNWLTAWHTLFYWNPQTEPHRAALLPGFGQCFCHLHGMLKQAFDDGHLLWDGSMGGAGWAAWVAITNVPDTAAMALFEAALRRGSWNGLRRILNWREEHPNEIDAPGTRNLLAAIARFEAERLDDIIPEGGKRTAGRL